MIEEKIIYHYTSFDKFNCILKDGSLRFKESTKSNDVLDTTLLFDVLKDYKGLVDDDDAIEAARSFMLKYYQDFAAQNQHISLVSCFARTGDSRLLWDAYTINRPSNMKCKHGENKYCYDSAIRYNGVCIAFNTQRLEEALKKCVGDICKQIYLQPIIYGRDKAKEMLNNWFGEACEKVRILSKEQDQSQDIIKPLVITGLTGKPLKEIKLKKCLVYPMRELNGKVDAFSPFFKHEFWRDENEVRASMCFHKENVSSKIMSDGEYMYYDVPITADCIDHIILGPEFSGEDISEIRSHNEYKLNFEKIAKKASIGTGIIRSK